jgi:hypothetical protein
VDLVGIVLKYSVDFVSLQFVLHNPKYVDEHATKTNDKIDNTDVTEVNNDVEDETTVIEVGRHIGEVTDQVR